ncbi:PREDICTED: uncharacterized protein LOC108564732 [Nicrophorus vespilloides]|uniref:Uncharacterized protein LOC108564732 n=1 Tax=Nicrophorus vespilloides TaxID=110193 RepID=A0ABM1MXM5_NICVS|nr:PREDICTED: uncharacterized protein LOC108564732 [Nicrophorus vespilloides]
MYERVHHRTPVPLHDCCITILERWHDHRPSRRPPPTHSDRRSLSCTVARVFSSSCKADVACRSDSPRTNCAFVVLVLDTSQRGLPSVSFVVIPSRTSRCRLCRIAGVLGAGFGKNIRG